MHENGAVGVNKTETMAADLVALIISTKQPDYFFWAFSSLFVYYHEQHRGRNEDQLYVKEGGFLTSDYSVEQAIRSGSNYLNFHYEFRVEQSDDITNKEIENFILKEMRVILRELFSSLNGGHQNSLVSSFWITFLKQWWLHQGRKASYRLVQSSLSKMFVKLMDVNGGEYVYDPACSVGCLLSAFADSKVSHLHGVEKDEQMMALAKITQAVFSESDFKLSSSDPLQKIDTLGCDMNILPQGNYHAVVSVPVWGQKRWYKPGSPEENEFHAYSYDTVFPPQSSADYAYIVHMLKSMRPENGRMAIVVPHGVLFRKSTEGTIRKRIVISNLLDAIIALPPKLFTGSSIPTVLLIFKASKPDQLIQFIDVSDQYHPGRSLNQLKEEAVEFVVDSYFNRKAGDKSRLVTISEIAANDYNLNTTLYLKPIDKYGQQSLKDIRKERSSLLSEIDGIDRQIGKAFESLGYGVIASKSYVRDKT